MPTHVRFIMADGTAGTSATAAADSVASQADADRHFAEELDSFTDSQLATYKEAFAAFDSTGNGCISRTG
jgi:hypothetical protein